MDAIWVIRACHGCSINTLNSQHSCHGLYQISAMMEQPCSGHAASFPDKHLFFGKSLKSDAGADSALGRCSRIGLKLTATAVRMAGKTGHNNRERERLRG